MTYCANCGSPVDGRFCPKCGAPAAAESVPGGSGYTPPPPPPGAGYTPGPTPGYTPPPSGQSLGMEENLAAALCYIPIIGLIFLLIDPYKQNRTIRFHAWQSLFFSIAWFVVRFVLGIFYTAMPFGLWPVWALLMSLLSLAFLGLLIFMAIKAYQRDRVVLPVITPLAEKQAG